MKREIEMYVDVFKEKSGKISCNIMYQGVCNLMRDKSLNKYIDGIIKLKDSTLCDADDEIKIYVDIRGIGYAVYDMLKDKYKNTYKLNYEKHDSKPVKLNAVKDAMYITENGIDFYDWKSSDIGAIKCDNIALKGKNNANNTTINIEKVELPNASNISNADNLINEITKLAKVKFQ